MFESLKPKIKQTVAVAKTPKKPPAPHPEQKSAKKDGKFGKAPPRPPAKGGGGGVADTRQPMPCVRWLCSGKCSVGDSCRFCHIKDGVLTPSEKFPANFDTSTLGDAKSIPCRFNAEGNCNFGDACPLSHTLKPKAKPKPKAKVLICANPHAKFKNESKQCEEWVLDTGTGLDVAGDLDGARIVSAASAPELATAGGIVQPTEASAVFIEELGADVCALKLPQDDAPKALSVGKRCATQGYEIWWQPWAPTPVMRRPDGSYMTVSVENFVPFITSRHSRASQDTKFNVLPVIQNGHDEIEDVVCVEEICEDGDITPRLPQFDPDGNPYVDSIAGEGPSYTVLQDSISEVGEQVEPIDPDVRAFVRALDGGHGAHDDAAYGDTAQLKVAPVPDAPEELIAPTRKSAHLSVHHLALHLPADVANCKGCAFAKKTRQYSRRRPKSGVTIESEDAVAQPFGACFHLDHITMKHGTEAAKSASGALSVLDEKTEFKGLMPTNSREHREVLQQVRQFEGAEPAQQARRWWTDCAPEFRAASREIRRLRPLAHFTSPPYRPCANGIIERSNRVVEEGTNAALCIGGGDAKWWVCAGPFWVTMFNGFSVGPDGQTPWERRFQTPAPFKLYPWGALVFVKPPIELEGAKRKFEPKVLPHVLVSIGIGPGCIFNHTYGVVKLTSLLGDNRPSRARIRYTTDIQFPEVPSFPLRLKLNATGSLGDASLPGPAVADAGESFGVAEAQEDSDDGIDGSFGENKPMLQSTYFEAVSLDPEEASPPDAEDDAFVVAAREEIAPLADDEISRDGIRAPAGWRIDVFGSRQVSVPPWSRRPPNARPEDWILTNKKRQDELRAAWSTEDPDSFNKQEARRAAYIADKVARRTIAAPVLQKSDGVMHDASQSTTGGSFVEFLDCEAEVKLSDPPGDLIEGLGPKSAGKFEVTSPSNPTPCLVNPCSRSQRKSQVGAIEQLEQLTKEKILSGKFERLLIELCCEESSELSENVVGRSLAIRVTQSHDMTSKRTIKALHKVIRTSQHMNLSIHVWVSIPCTAGCSFKFPNAAKGIATGDFQLTEELVRIAIGVCKHVDSAGGFIHWEWPKTSDLWNLECVKEFLGSRDAKTSLVSTAAAGLKFQQPDGSRVCLKKFWRIDSTCPALTEELKKFEKLPDDAKFTECKGQKAKDSARYTKVFAKSFWKAIVPQKRVISAAALQRAVENYTIAAEEEIWPSLVVRQIALSSAEAKTPAAKAAFDKELSGHRRRGTWDESTVREFSDLMRDPTKKEVMHGRIFGILGNKNDECDASLQEMKYRSVFQGSNIRTKTGVSAIDLFEEVSSAPASFTAIRCALAAAVLRGLVVSVRDALQAYLQARINTPDRIETWVSLPPEYLPDEWFVDGSARTKTKYKNPVVLLILALYGHPESGALWDALLTKALTCRGWHTIPEWPGVFIHSDLSVLIVYVDDLMLCTKLAQQKAHWSSLDEAVEFKEGPAPIGRFIGAHYQLDDFKADHAAAPRTLTIDMRSYVSTMAQKFSDEAGLKLRKVASPFLADEQWASDCTTPGIYANSCASHAATSLFTSRVARPDLTVITQRLCSAVSRWTTVHDAALVRLMSYCQFNAEFVLKGTLAPEDFEDVVINPYPDADWNGDPMTTKSTTGFWVELFAEKSGRSWPLSWGSVSQTSTGSCTAETETVAASHTLRREAIPIQLLFEHMLGRRLPIRMHIDNMQAISAIQKGYSKKLRYLARTQRVCIGLLNDLLCDEECLFSVVHCPTLEMKGDLFTKALIPQKFADALEMIGMRWIGE